MTSEETAQKPWANFVNERDDDHYVPWMDCCPHCKKPSPVGWEGWRHEKSGTDLDLWYCAECEIMLNFDEDDPKATIRWLTKTEAKEKGMKIVESGENLEEEEKEPERS